MKRKRETNQEQEKKESKKGRRNKRDEEEEQEQEQEEDQGKGKKRRRLIKNEESEDKEEVEQLKDNHNNNQQEQQQEIDLEFEEEDANQSEEYEEVETIFQQETRIFFFRPIAPPPSTQIQSSSSNKNNNSLIVTGKRAKNPPKKYDYNNLNQQQKMMQELQRIAKQNESKDVKGGKGNRNKKQADLEKERKKAMTSPTFNPNSLISANYFEFIPEFLTIEDLAVLCGPNPVLHFELHTLETQIENKDKEYKEQIEIDNIQKKNQLLNDNEELNNKNNKRGKQKQKENEKENEKVDNKNKKKSGRAKKNISESEEHEEDDDTKQPRQKRTIKKPTKFDDEDFIEIQESSFLQSQEQQLGITEIQSQRQKYIYDLSNQQIVTVEEDQFTYNQRVKRIQDENEWIKEIREIIVQFDSLKEKLDQIRKERKIEKELDELRLEDIENQQLENTIDINSFVIKDIPQRVKQRIKISSGSRISELKEKIADHITQYNFDYNITDNNTKLNPYRIRIGLPYKIDNSAIVIEDENDINLQNQIISSLSSSSQSQSSSNSSSSSSSSQPKQSFFEIPTGEEVEQDVLDAIRKMEEEEEQKIIQEQIAQMEKQEKLDKLEQDKQQQEKLEKEKGDQLSNDLTSQTLPLPKHQSSSSSNQISFIHPFLPLHPMQDITIEQQRMGLTSYSKLFKDDSKILSNALLDKQQVLQDSVLIQILDDPQGERLRKGDKIVNMYISLEKEIGFMKEKLDDDEDIESFIDDREQDDSFNSTRVNVISDDNLQIVAVDEIAAVELFMLQSEMEFAIMKMVKSEGYQSATLIVELDVQDGFYQIKEQGISNIQGCGLIIYEGITG
ncbi:MAG: hypothetical protein EZS28_018916 [Streblomastix strix]|uniref:Uncharacterized protein n=1 Tax=Streblomastix strix TaxID=222440 RepID=A0A5J4VSK2_9EUKA|nr:MAG: hypothetical protein EZS28_018916 [Streblomastix strix]